LTCKQLREVFINLSEDEPIAEAEMVRSSKLLKLVQGLHWRLETELKQATMRKWIQTVELERVNQEQEDQAQSREEEFSQLFLRKDDGTELTNDHSELNHMLQRQHQRRSSDSTTSSALFGITGVGASLDGSTEHIVDMDAGAQDDRILFANPHYSDGEESACRVGQWCSVLNSRPLLLP
jgi:hypothetical protein